MDAAASAATAPDRATQGLIVAIAELSAIVLLVLREGIDREWPGCADPGLRMLLYTLAIAPPLVLALSVERRAAGGNPALATPHSRALTAVRTGTRAAHRTADFRTGRPLRLWLLGARAVSVG